MMKRRRISRDFKLKMIERLEARKSGTALAQRRRGDGRFGEIAGAGPTSWRPDKPERLPTRQRNQARCAEMRPRACRCTLRFPEEG